MKILTITVVVLAALFVAVDRIAVHYAQREAARLATTKYGFGDSTDGSTRVGIDGFPFLTQALSGDFDHVTLTAGKFFVDSGDNAVGGYLDVQRLRLDMHGVQVTSLTSRTAQADLVTGDMTLTYADLSGALTRLASQGGPLTVTPAPGSQGQAGRVHVSGTRDGRPVSVTATVLAQGDEVMIEVPGVTARPLDWKLSLPVNVGFTSATSTPTGVDLAMVGHQVTLGSSVFTGGAGR
ncbi:DUF2993 domain-containing protein [Streptantibioticus parmotrematis]|uniref:LmeA family phospholipid-binding protein n=1 Tax=Streptantibioticus parmotrematis TaxID=2873249 RepID=UPI0033C4D051